MVDKLNISIHKALTGLDVLLFLFFVHPSIFQSTRPSRASTLYFYIRGLGEHISIHKALTGLDVTFD